MIWRSRACPKKTQNTHNSPHPHPLLRFHNKGVWSAMRMKTSVMFWAFFWTCSASSQAWWWFRWWSWSCWTIQCWPVLLFSGGNKACDATDRQTCSNELTIKWEGQWSNIIEVTLLLQNIYTVRETETETKTEAKREQREPHHECRCYNPKQRKRDASWQENRAVNNQRHQAHSD